MLLDDDDDEVPAEPARRAALGRRTLMDESSDEEGGVAPMDVVNAPNAGSDTYLRIPPLAWRIQILMICSARLYFSGSQCVPTVNVYRINPRNCWSR